MHRLKKLRQIITTKRTGRAGGRVSRFNGARVTHKRVGGKIATRYIGQYSNASPLDQSLVNNITSGGSLGSTTKHATKTVLNEISKALGNLSMKKGKGVVRRIK